MSVAMPDRAVPRGFAVVVVLLTLFGGLWAVFASSARADSHTSVITVDCNGWSLMLDNYDSPFTEEGPNFVTITVDGGVVVDNQRFGDSYSMSGSWDRTMDHMILFDVSDPEDPDGDLGWTFSRMETVVCAEPTTTTAPTTTTTTAPTTTTTTVAPSTLPFTGAESVSSALLGVVLFGSGALALLFVRRAED